MELNNHFGAKRNGEGAAKKRSTIKSKALDLKAFPDEPTFFQECLQDVSDIRLEAVARAEKLIADPDYPPKELLQTLAHHLAIRLLADIEPFSD